MKKNNLLLFCVFLFNSIIAQNLRIGEWKDHLSYKNAVSVSEGNGKIYCATTGGIFIVNQSDNSVERLSKVNGLSDVEPAVLNYNTSNNKLLIAYKNSNIDIISNGTIINLSDIKRKSIVGDKSINTIYFINQFAYLACGFGIVVIDLDRLEVSDTYYIGANGNALNVRDITDDGTYIYAATDVGIYKALKNNSNLADFNSWSLMSGLPTGIYNTIVSFNGKLYTNLSPYLANKNNIYKDSIYVYDYTSWTSIFGSGFTTNQLKVSDNNLVISQIGAVSVYNSSLAPNGYFSGYYGGNSIANQALIKNGKTWIADNKYGLVSWQGGYNSIYPNGPSSNNASNMSLEENNLWVAPGGVNNAWGNVYYIDGLYKYSNDSWNTIKGNYSSIINFDTIYDITNVIVDPKNPKHAYASTWGAGVIELSDDVPTKLYTNKNSSLQTLQGFPGYAPIWTYGLAFDASNNLWVTNTGTPNALSYKTPSGSWSSLNFFQVLGNFSYLGQILVTKNDQKWVIISRGGGLMVYQSGTAAPNSSNAKKLSTATGDGALPSTNVICLAEDKDGEIWVGTDKGITVFYTPENVFTNQNFDSQQILIEQDGHVQILLETELIQSIAVDDINRKWIATANSGVYLMSADGTKQIYHFDETNSPLLSNDVKSIVINHNTGDIFFGTSKGIVSFRGTATKPEEFFDNVFAFPNPVKHDYAGPIVIKGLVENTKIKITDISGTLVYETTSEGGQAYWYAKNFKGERVNSGVYMVFCTNEDGSQKIATKILVIN